MIPSASDVGSFNSAAGNIKSVLPSDLNPTAGFTLFTNGDMEVLKFFSQDCYNDLDTVSSSESVASLTDGDSSSTLDKNSALVEDYLSSH